MNGSHIGIWIQHVKRQGYHDSGGAAMISDKELHQKLIKIFQDVIDNRCFELSYDEIREIIKELQEAQR